MSDNDARIKALEKEVAELKTSISSFGKKPRRKNDDTKKTPSPYNLFVKKFLNDQRKELGDKYNHPDAFKQAAIEWNKKKELN